MYGMRRTTVYLPEDLKAQLERLARRERRTEADLIREALSDMVERRTAPRPRGGLGDSGDPYWAMTADQDMTGFGEQ